MTGLFDKILLDTNVLIIASKIPFGRSDQSFLEEILAHVKPSSAGTIVGCNHGFWDLLAHANEQGRMVASIDLVLEELLKGADALAEWARVAPKGFFEPTFGTEVDERHHEVLDAVKARKQFTGKAVLNFTTGADSRLIAYAKVEGATVATLERRRDASTGTVSIPTVCEWEGI